MTRRTPPGHPAADSTSPWLRPRAAYVHVPFCAHKCGYCDFASVAGQDDRADEYLTALEAEMSGILESPTPVRTLFVGGGTPTYLSVAQLDRLLERLAYWFRSRELIEFTVESNPNTLDEDKVRVLADHGVNRISLGAQSFHPRLLETLERNHDPASVGRAVERIRKRIENISIDLIFGVPGQTLEEWDRDLTLALSLEPHHLSAYGLTYEKGTRLWSQRRLGIVQPLGEELEGAMYERVMARVAESGWIQYEVSNHARPRSSPMAIPSPPSAWYCEHNLVYWANHAYYGFGTGAAAYVHGTRTLNTRELGAYIDRCRSGRSPITQEETLDDESRARETAMLQLRRAWGLSRAEFHGQTGHGFDELVGARLAPFVEMGLVFDEGEVVRLSRSGFLVADGILQKLLY